jgi:hypothetical protein
MQAGGPGTGNLPGAEYPGAATGVLPAERRELRRLLFSWLELRSSNSSTSLTFDENSSRGRAQKLQDSSALWIAHRRSFRGARLRHGLAVEPRNDFIPQAKECVLVRVARMTAKTAGLKHRQNGASEGTRLGRAGVYGSTGSLRPAGPRSASSRPRGPWRDRTCSGGRQLGSSHGHGRDARHSGPLRVQRRRWRRTGRGGTCRRHLNGTCARLARRREDHQYAALILQQDYGQPNPQPPSTRTAHPCASPLAARQNRPLECLPT